MLGVTVSNEKRIKARLAAAKMRITRPRVILGEHLFSGADRHVNADQLYRETRSSTTAPSLATIYNTLNQFTAAGLLREIPLEGQRSFFDTRTSPHQHFLIDDTGEMFDAPEGYLQSSLAGPPPAGFEIHEIQVVVRLKQIKSQNR